MAEYISSLKTVKKWEEELNCELEKNVANGKVTSIKCKVCIKFEATLKTMRSFTPAWIEGTKSVKKDTLQKHLKSELHLKALDLQNKTELAPSKYNEHVLVNTPIGRGLVRMADIDRENLRVCFNTAYHIAKSEQPYSDYPGLLDLQFKNGVQAFNSYKNDRAAAQFVDVIADELKDNLIKLLTNARYISLLTDGSTDSSTIEEELIYVLFLDQDGRPKVKFLSVEEPEHASAEGLKEAIGLAFSRIDFSDFHLKLHGFNVDGASVNMGVSKGLAALLCQQSPWLTTVHCFNHRFELAIKDAFKGTFFDEIDTFLTKLFYLYKKSSKRLRELRRFAEIFEQSVPKPAKVNGTRWIAHKLRAMAIVIQNYGMFILCVCFFSN